MAGCKKILQNPSASSHRRPQKLQGPWLALPWGHWLQMPLACAQHGEVESPNQTMKNFYKLLHPNSYPKHTIYIYIRCFLVANFSQFDLKFPLSSCFGHAELSGRTLFLTIRECVRRPGSSHTRRSKIHANEVTS